MRNEITVIYLDGVFALASDAWTGIYRYPTREEAEAARIMQLEWRKYARGQRATRPE